MTRPDVAVERLAVSAYTVPTEEPESDGTLTWEATTVVVVRAEGGGAEGLGYTYGDAAAASVAARVLAPLVEGASALDVPAAWARMVGALRNAGTRGIGAHAVAAVDTALWDLKARLLGVPLVTLLGAVRDAVPVYASGGFTSYPLERLTGQLRGWVDAGIRQVKMKVGREPADDIERVHAARAAVGPDVGLFVDANGAYDRKQALEQASGFADAGVTWYEEPVSSDDLDGLRLLRDRAPAGMEISAGEYGYDLFDFRRLLAGGAVDVLQADATRCAGITGFLRAGALCDAYAMPLSSHTAPALHLHACCALPRVRHMEWFHDHVLIERELFDGAPEPQDGLLRPDRGRPGLGLELKTTAAKRYAA
jgi:L-alanine-DL-glutamate epimerase-like enolase superfamily enzyme